MSTAHPAILFLIPDVRLRDIYLARFEHDGWEADSAATIVDAERRAVQLRPSVVFIHRDALEDVPATLKRLRALPTLLKARLVLAAQTMTREAVDEALSAGARDVVLTGHLTPKELVKRMNHLIEKDV